MNSIIKERIASLQRLLDQEQVAAFIIPSTDPHQSEYVAAHWMSREWISGFSGSAGTVVVTTKGAGLWTDSRYFLQAENQLQGSGIRLYKEMLPDTPSIPAFISGQLQAGDNIGIDGAVFSVSAVLQLQQELEKDGLLVRDIGDPFNRIWTDRPNIPDAPAFIHELPYAGETCADKIHAIRKQLKQKNTDALLLTALDEIAWTLNLRGCDVHCNPVVISYLLIEKKTTHYFIEENKIPNTVKEYLEANQITVHPYNEIFSFLNHIECTSIWIDPVKTNYAIYSAIHPACEKQLAISPVGLMKAIKNPQEIQGIRNAMVKDGIALVKFLKWLEEVVPSNKETEISIDRKLHTLRAEQPLYIGESFDTIAGYGEHGAIVHYEATEATDATLHPTGFLLLDSGAQYLDGTTDITRTIALGELNEEEKTDYTLILKGHIALAQAVFPEGTRGTQLDVLARMPIWKKRMNYLHGTGHGVGHFLNVHEGPQSIRMNENPIPLQEGMITSNEPGVYKAGSHGIRIENLILTVPAGKGMFGNYLQFETLTLCPICTKGIVKELLTNDEVDWLNQYHQMVFERLSAHLNEDEKDWLKKACQAI